MAEITVLNIFLGSLFVFKAVLIFFAGYLLGKNAVIRGIERGDHDHLLYDMAKRTRAGKVYR